MRRVLLIALLVGLMGALALPALAGNGAMNDKDNDCWFPGVPPPHGTFEATDLRVQKVKTPAGNGQFHCHGMIDDLSQAPAKAVRLSGEVCYLPAYFQWEPGVGNAVITPNGDINLTCHFGK